MPLLIVRNDITKMNVDAIVNAAGPSLKGSGGVDGAIHRAAGPELLEECRALGGCAVGEARLTGAYRLPCRWEIHTVGPRWQGGDSGEKQQLEACYRASLALALEQGCETIAFPLISAGTFGYPADRAIRVAIDVIGAFLMEHEMTVYLVFYGADSTELGRRLFPDIQESIDDSYVEQRVEMFRRRAEAAFEEQCADLNMAPMASGASPGKKQLRLKPAYQKSELPKTPPPKPTPPKEKAPKAFPALSAADALSEAEEDTLGIDRLLQDIDESFQQMLLRKIDESGMSDAQCYKRANIDRKLFSKIRGDVHYRPKKTTAVAFAVALRLDLLETEELLRKAGYALSRSSKFDIIIRYFIGRGKYDVFEINEALFCYDQSLLGS